MLSHRGVGKYLGAPPYADNKSDLFNKIGVASGLAWTSVGGEILFIEAITTKGDGKVTITGKLGDVMKESVHAAWSVVKSKAIEYNIDSEALEKQICMFMCQKVQRQKTALLGVALIMRRDYVCDNQTCTKAL